MNLQSIALLIVVAASVFFALRGTLAGKRGCSGGCCGCPYAGSCGAEARREKS